MALRQILEYPNPLLKKRAAPVATIGGEVATLIEDLAETMYAAPGVGLAATQVGVGQRVIVLDIHGEDEAPGKRLLKLINPEIAEREGAERVLEGGVAQPLGLQHGEPVCLGQALHRGRRHPEPAAARAVGLADDAHHRIGARQERFQDRAREGGRTHEHDAPGGQMGSGRGPSLGRPWRSSLRRRAR